MNCFGTPGVAGITFCVLVVCSNVTKNVDLKRMCLCAFHALGRILCVYNRSGN